MSKDHAIDPDLVREIAKLISDTDLTEIEVEKGDLKIRVARQVTVAPVVQHVAAAPMAAPVAAAAAPAAPAAAPKAAEKEKEKEKPKQEEEEEEGDMGFSLFD